MSTAAVIGSTGFVGGFILNTLLSSAAFARVSTIGRRAPSNAEDPSSKLNAISDVDTTKWAGHLQALSPVPTAVFTALGTTRVVAGSIAAQWKIDHDLNVELAQAAKAAGVETFVFVSSAGTRGFISGHAPYARMKVGVEDAVEKLGFPQSIVLRPALILGQRPPDERKTEFFNTVVQSLGKVSPALRDALGQEADVIARAAVRAVLLAKEGKAPAKHWVLEGADIIRLGTPEWKDGE